MGKVIVNEERCKGCGYCLAVCRRESLGLEPGRRNQNGYAVAVFLDGHDCDGCARCAEVCPDVALEIYR